MGEPGRGELGKANIPQAAEQRSATRTFGRAKLPRARAPPLRPAERRVIVDMFQGGAQFPTGGKCAAYSSPSA